MSERPECVPCVNCRGDLLVAETGPIPRYCSATCRARAAYARTKTDGRYDQMLAARRDRPHIEYQLSCAVCSSPFVGKRRDRVYCSKRCAAVGNPNRCDQDGCNKPRRAKGLCVTHYNEASYSTEQRREQRAQLRTCEHCGETYPAQRAGQRFCSLLCRSGGEFKRTYSDAQRRAFRENARRRRAALRTVEVEAFDEREIYERDGWRCQICRMRVPQDKQWPHPQSPTLDHIVPLTEDGTSHTRRNVRLAHLVCNSSRSNRGGNEQLALIG